MKHLRRYLLSLVLLFGVSTIATAQFKLGNWRYVPIPMDSVSTVIALQFSDSLHGYFAADRITSVQDTTYGFRYNTAQYWFRTSDGGLTWERMYFSGLSAYNMWSLGPFTWNSYFPVLFTTGTDTVFFCPINGGYPAQGNNILRSTDNGNTWSAMLNGYKSHDLTILSVFDGQHLLSYDQKGDRYGLSFSNNGGASFAFPRSDTNFKKAVFPYPSDTKITNSVILLCDWFDSLHWTCILQPGISWYDSVFAPGLTTLLTSNAGKSWKPYTYTPQWYKPTYSKPPFEGGKDFDIQPQAIKGTSEMYLWTGGGFEGSYGCDNCNPSGSLRNISFLYSSDYGATWKENRSYGKNRRAYEALGNGIIWMTACEQDTILDKLPATQMLKSTDNGVTWENDKYALNVPDYGVLDGRILTFTDPNHGWCAAVMGNSQFSGGKPYIMRYEPMISEDVKKSDTQSKFDFCNIFPNPAAYSATFVMPPQRKLYDIDIYDIYGRKPTYSIEKLDWHTQIVDTHLMPSGLYLAKITFDYGWFTEILTIIR